MTAHLIIESRGKDQAKYQRCIQQVPGTVNRFGGRYLARGNHVIRV